MRVFVALLIDGVENGPRVPADIHFEQPQADDGFGFLRVSLEKPITLGPASRSGVGVIKFFLDNETSDYALETKTRALLPGQSITYTPT